MSPKRERSSDSDEKPSTSGSPKKSPRKERQDWTLEEETKFLTIIDDIVKANLWSMAKEQPEFSGRKHGAVMSHWNAMASLIFVSCPLYQDPQLLLSKVRPKS
ncbi:uncharacterized protein L201_004195 [Kwoniella dendrophila CBS 6074]|uniref:Myb-like domain-containing protein n=1 Tax=Kwoniella dendrophila CBS 6074 TaxID=1295534 RepID=A0AAX4JWV8_9TREE